MVGDSTVYFNNIFEFVSYSKEENEDKNKSEEKDINYSKNNIESMKIQKKIFFLMKKKISKMSIMKIMILL